MERREKCAPSFHFNSSHPTCSHYCRSCLLFALLARETGSVLCRIARCFGDAITFLNGHYDVVNGELGQNATQNTPFMEVDTTPTQSQARPQNNHGAPARGLWRTFSWASNTFTRWSYSLQWQMVVLTHGASFNFRRFL